MDYTTNYQLPVWAETDRILRTDFNDLTDKIEEALGALQGDVDANTAGLSTASTELNTKGNCQTFLTSYVGTGNVQGTRPITFPSTPFLVVIYDIVRWDTYVLNYGATSVCGSQDISSYNISWSGNTLNLPTDRVQTALNEAGATYQVFALLEL